MSNGRAKAELSVTAGNDSGKRPVTPPSVIRFVRERLLAILLPAILIGAAVLAISLPQAKIYRATAEVLIRDSAFDFPVVASQDAAREVTTNVDLLGIGLLRERVENRLKRPFEGSIDVGGDTVRSSLATITASDADPRLAARAANTYAEAYLDLREQVVRRQIEEERQATLDRLAALPTVDRIGAQGEALRIRLERLVLADVAGGGAKIVTPAEAPANPSSPKPLQNTLIGALVGLALGVLLAIAMERRDRRVRDPRYIEYVLGRPIIGRIPRSRALAKTGRTTQALPPAEAEAFRTVRANLRQQLREQGARSVLVTSAIPNEGKTTVVWNLARVAAAGGARVLLVEADMRRPALAHSLAANGAGKAGLAELLAGEAQLADLIRTIDFQEHGEANDGHGSVDVLFAGTPPANPSELLDSQRMQAILEVVPDSYDLVIVDTPPTVVSDAMPIVDHVGGVLVVGRLGMSTDESLMELREQLDKLDAPTLGVVVNGGAAGLTPHWRTGAVRS